MKKMMVLLTLTVLLVLVGSAQAMESDNYKLDWFTPLSGSGGGTASSDHYALNVTIGQAITGASDSSSYAGCLGYWCGGVGTAAAHSIYLPLVLRSAA
jgi:hypothetical protein